jgi:hypothetical protein
MMVAGENDDRSSGGESIRVVYFYGDNKTKYREWSLKTEAIGQAKKWGKALLAKEYKIAELTRKDEDEELTLTKTEQLKFDTTHRRGLI